MKTPKLIFSLAQFCLLFSLLKAQTPWVVNGAQVVIKGTEVYFDGNFFNQNNGTIDNTGEIYLTGHWTNNAGNYTFINSSPGSVLLTGGNQNITGNSVTKFFKLKLFGTGIKTLVNIDAIAEDTLSLNDRELATDVNTMFVTNPATGIIIRTTGFLSSLGNGSLSRATNSANPYLFPVGSSSGTQRYRPVEITPNSASADTFTVRMANVNATTEGFDINLKDNTLSLVNPDFYHRINRTAGNDAADITIYFDAAADGDYAAIAHWQSASGGPQWENTGTVTSLGNYGLSGLKKQGWSDFSYTPFALAKTQSEETKCGDVFVPNIFSPNNDNENDLLFVFGNCLKEMYFTVYDRWGERLFETTDQNKGWDGKYRNKEAGTGAYVYYLKGTLTDDTPVFLKGTATLVR